MSVDVHPKFLGRGRSENALLLLHFQRNIKYYVVIILGRLLLIIIFISDKNALITKRLNVKSVKFNRRLDTFIVDFDRILLDIWMHRLLIKITNHKFLLTIYYDNHYYCYLFLYWSYKLPSRYKQLIQNNNNNNQYSKTYLKCNTT